MDSIYLRHRTGTRIEWATATRSRPDQIITIPGVPSFPRDPHQTHWGRVGIDATKRLAYASEFERKVVPGLQDLQLQDYVVPSSAIPSS